MRLTLYASPLLFLLGCPTPDDSGKETGDGTETGDTNVETGDSETGGDTDTDTATGTDADGDGYTDDVDCDDGNAAIHPDATEVCDDVDNNCNDLVDDDDPANTGGTAGYVDADGDKYGDPTQKRSYCDGLPAGAANNGGDCDDTNAAISPNATEICDDANTDEDCDGNADDLDSSTDPATKVPVALDEDGDGYGSATATVLYCDATTISDDDCDDSNVDVNPGAAETCDNGLDDNCDGVTTGCELGGEIELGPGVGMKIVGDASQDRFGEVSVSAGDIDGDGMDEFWVAADYFDTKDEGGLFLFDYPLREGASVADATRVVLGASDSDSLGTNLAAGDLDGDGTIDLVAAAPYSTDKTSVYGELFVWLGSPADGADTSSADLHITGANGSSSFGQRGLFVADVSGDGTDDLLAFDQGGNAIRVWTGPVADGTYTSDEAPYNYTTPVVNSTGTTPQQLSAGDADGDGADELLFGSPTDETGGRGAGAAWLVAGGSSPGGDLATGALMTLTGATVNDSAGVSVALDGDGNGDGYMDTLVGAQDGGTGGAAYVLYSVVSGTSSLSTVADYVSSATAGDKLGSSVSWLGDVDGDGFDDIGVGMSGASGASRTSGGMIVVFGPLEGALDSTAADVVIYSEGSNDAAGTAIRPAGDINGDSLNDIVLDAHSNASNTGAAWIIYGGGL